MINNKPFLLIPNEKHTVKLFLNAVSDGNLERAKTLLSRKLLVTGIIDFDKLKKIVGKDNKYSYINGVNDNIGDDICKKSVIINGSILHLYLVREPYETIAWKIYGLEKEPGGELA
jgi:hypothetical protein